MGTRFYFDSRDAAQVTPSSWSTGWNKTGISTGTLTTPKRSTTAAAANQTLSGTSGHNTAVNRWVSSPLKAQTISGTIKGQILCKQAAAGDNTTMAVAVKIIKPDGSDRAVLLAVAASDDTSATPPENDAAAFTNRKLRDASENTAIALTSQSASDGDLLVVEIGFRQASTSTASCSVTVGSDSGTDLAEDDTTTAFNNPWIEFSGDILTQPIYWYGSASNPADNGSANEPVTLAITPPTGMLAGDLVIICGFERDIGTNLISQSELGGQSWTVIQDDTAAGAFNLNGAFWFCEFDGTWDANPSIAFASAGGTTPTTAVLHVFRGATAWAIDVAMGPRTVLSPATVFPITAQNPVANDTISFAAWGNSSGLSWSSIAGASWENCGSDSYRNLAGSDQSCTFAYVYVADGTTPANVSKTTSVSAGVLMWIVTLKGTVPPTSVSKEVPSGNLALSAFAPDVVLFNPRSIDVPSGNLALSAVAPERVAKTLRDVPSGNLLLSAVAPDRFRADTIQPTSGNLALSAVAPDRLHAVTVQPLSGNLALSAVAPTVARATGIEIPSGNLALSAVAPTVVWTNHRSIAVPSGDLALTREGPTVSAGDDRSIAISAGDLALSSVAPDRTATANVSIAVQSGNLLLSTVAPTVAVEANVINIAVPSANLVLSAFTPDIVSGALLKHYLRPDGDISDGGWTTHLGGTDLYTVIDEPVTPDDTDYIRSSENPVNDTCEVSLTNPVGGITTPFKVKYRYARTVGGNMDLVVSLIQGTTIIASWTHNGIPASITAVEQTLTAPEAALITNANDLRLRFTANTPA